MDYKNILVQTIDGILRITINRPKNMNALNIATLVEIEDVFERHQFDKAIKGVIITGAGDKAFVAGADIAEFVGFTAGQGKTMAENGHKIFNKIENFPKPVVAAVNGFALGGGCELAMACHMRVAAASARFGQPEVNLGITPGYGGTQRLAELIGKGKALELLMTGDMIDAKTALQLGLVNYVEEDGNEIAKCEQLINKIGKKGPLAIAKVIACVNAKYRDGGNVGDSYQTEIDAFAESFNTTDFAEGTAAFLEKRKPNFTAT